MRGMYPMNLLPVVVHGGGKAITRAMEKAGLKAAFIQGQRVTDARTVEVVDQVLSREINPEVVSAINSFGGAARGFAGTDIFTCRKLWASGEAGCDVSLHVLHDKAVKQIVVRTADRMDYLRPWRVL